MIQETTKIGKRGSLVIPANLRSCFDLKEGSTVIAEEHAEGILIRPAMVIPVERYTLQQKAEFLLANAVDSEDYAEAVKEVRSMGIDPETIQVPSPEA